MNISGRIANVLRNAAQRLETGGFRALFRGVKAIKNTSEKPATNAASSGKTHTFDHAAFTQGFRVLSERFANYQSRQGNDKPPLPSSILPRASLSSNLAIESSVDLSTTLTGTTSGSLPPSSPSSSVSNSFLLGKNPSLENKVLVSTINNLSDVNRSVGLLNASPLGKSVSYRKDVAQAARAEADKLLKSATTSEKVAEKAEKKGVTDSLNTVKDSVSALKDRASALTRLADTIDARSLALKINDYKDVQKSIEGLKKQTDEFRQLVVEEALNLAIENRNESEKLKGSAEELRKDVNNKKAERAADKQLREAKELGEKAKILKAFSDSVATD